MLIILFIREKDSDVFVDKKCYRAFYYYELKDRLGSDEWDQRIFIRVVC